jgi:hypothetical protein
MISVVFIPSNGKKGYTEVSRGFKAQPGCVREPTVTGLRVRGDRFYFNLGDQQSDLWMAEIAGSR